MQDLRAIRFIKGTKISHDYEGSEVNHFSYRDLCERNIEAIGIPCKQNRLIIVDVDVPGLQHKHDGRPFWESFMAEYGIPMTYSVRTPSGGYHFYYRLPESVNPETFSPPGQLALGVDLKWNGWVGAPPTAGYDINWGNITNIEIAPPSLMNYIANLIQGKGAKTYELTDGVSLELHKPFTPGQLAELRNKLEWMQVNASLSYQEWRDGLFALKAGVDDPVLLHELTERWTLNRGYVPGDEHKAHEIVERADRYGGVGPGTIFAIINQVRLREGAPAVDTPFTNQEILDRSKVQISMDKYGKPKIETSESNAAALLGVIFDEKRLYHDVRTDLYIFEGESRSDTDLVNTFLPLLQSPEFGLGLEKFRKASVAAGLDVLMAKRRIDPHAEYLKRLVWDGIPRVERFFVNYVGATDSEYVRLVGKNFWASLAARGLRPGSKFDSMVVLEGHEGIAKSSLVEAIGGTYTFAPSRKDCFEHLDSLRQMHQAIIVELPELIGIIHVDDETIKNFISKPFDHIRALFAKRAMRQDRGFCMVGTTNARKYLRKGMGSRRFWPMEIPMGKSVNLAAIKNDRDQLFAEAVALYRDGHPYWHMPKELLDPIIEARLVDEPLIPAIRDMVKTLPDLFTTTDVYQRLEGSGLIQRGLTRQTIDRIEGALRRMDFEQLNMGREVKWRYPKNAALVELMSAMTPMSLESLI